MGEVFCWISCRAETNPLPRLPYIRIQYEGKGGSVSLCLLLRGFLLYLPDRTRSFGSLPSYIVAEMVVVVQGKANNMHPTPRRTRPPTFT
jgi:hypothetical protein